MSPLYDFCCEKGHVTEARAGLDVTALACPACGRDARRLSVYESQYINGETVAKGVTKASRMGNVVDKHGRYRVDLFQEATAECGGVTPGMWDEAKRRARRMNRGKVMDEPRQIKTPT